MKHIKTLFFLTTLLFASLATSEEKTYPNVICGHNWMTVNFIKKVQPKVYAEFGLSIGSTALEVSKILPEDAEMYIFDFHEKVQDVKQKLYNAGFNKVHAFGNSYKLRDSYNWSLMTILEQHTKPIFDYAFLDGMHTWETDGFAFLLIDKLLKPGGYIDFDDYNWTLAGSETLGPRHFPLTAKLYTNEQIRTRSIKKIIDLLVRRNKNYKEIVKNKIFQKIN